MYHSDCIPLDGAKESTSKKGLGHLFHGCPQERRGYSLDRLRQLPGLNVAIEVEPAAILSISRCSRVGMGFNVLNYNVFLNEWLAI